MLLRFDIRDNSCQNLLPSDGGVVNRKAVLLQPLRHFLNSIGFQNRDDSVKIKISALQHKPVSGDGVSAQVQFVHNAAAGGEGAVFPALDGPARMMFFNEVSPFTQRLNPL